MMASTSKLAPHRATEQDVDEYLLKHGFDYVDEGINANLNCPICRSPFVQPVVSHECGHVFCLPCLEAHHHTSSTCPIDRQPLVFGDLRPAPRLIHSLVEELVVRCPHCDQGCSFQGQRHLLRAHLIAECAFGETLCPCSKECRRLVLKRDLPAHVEACEYALVACPMSCGARLRRAELETHAETTCPNKEVACTHRCGRENLTRAELPHHYAEECPKATITCPHRRFGCDWTGTRTMLEGEHLLECAYEGIKGYLQASEAKARKVEEENNQLKARLAKMEERQERAMADMTALRGALGDFAPPPALPKAPSSEPVVPRVAPIHLQDTLGDMMDSVNKLQSSLENLELRQEATFMHETVRLQEEVQGLRAAVHGVRLQTAWLLLEQERRGAGDGASSAPPEGMNPGMPDFRSRMAAIMAGTSPAALFGGPLPPAQAVPSPFVRRPSERQDVKL